MIHISSVKIFQRLYIVGLSCLATLMPLLVFSSCSEDKLEQLTPGTLRIHLEGVVATVVTRATPSEIGKPEANTFRITVTDTEGKQVYNQPYSDEGILLAPADYTVEATFGDNPVVGIDAPYYEGSTPVTVETHKQVQADITCKVANALISVRFGKDEAEKARFDKYYETYSLQVHVGDESAEIPNDESSKSAYLRTGSSATLVFTGKLRVDGHEVSVPLDVSKSTFPSVFKAAQHAVVTLTMPDPQSATVVDISKVELEEATMEETIPISWLPIPQVNPTHNYDADGNLQGTDITFTNSYPGMTWKVDVTDVDGQVTYRSVEGSGELHSVCQDNTDGWAYMPTGQYKATFYLLQGEKVLKTGSRTFSVSSPNLKASVSAYTSYDRYQEGDVDAANACDAYTVYSPVVSVNIASALWNNAKYNKEIRTTLNSESLSDATVSGGKEGTIFTFKDQGNKLPSFDAYVLTGTLTFDKTSVTDKHEVYITGLPVTFAPPTKDVWSESGKVTWDHTDNNKSCVRLGWYYVSIWDDGKQHYVTCSRFAVPTGVKIEASYDLSVQSDYVAHYNKITLSFGGYEYFVRQMESMTKEYYTDVASFTTESPVSETKANISYGRGQSNSCIYSLAYKYGK